MIVFLVSGLWHGNSINYVIWGLYQGILNVISPKRSEQALFRGLQMTGTFACVMFGWILFKTTSFWDTLEYIGIMFSKLKFNMDGIISSVLPFTGDYSCLAYLLTIMLFIMILVIQEWRDYHQKTVYVKFRYTLYFILIIFFGMIGDNSFIYANF